MTQKDIEEIKKQGAIAELKNRILDKISEIRSWDCVYSSDDEFIAFDETMEQTLQACSDARMLFEELQKMEPDTHK